MPLIDVVGVISSLVAILATRRRIVAAKRLSDEKLPSGYEIENDLPKKLMAFWRSKGCDVESVWAERIICPNGGVSLGVELFPGDSCFSRGKSRGLEDAVKWLMRYLVKCRLLSAENIWYNLTNANESHVMIACYIAPIVLKRASEFPVQTLIGPRQSGSVALVRECSPEYS